MLVRALSVLLPAICALIIIAAAPVRDAAAATPTATPSVEPTATPIPNPAIIIHVINDLNGDGIRQSGEPGLPGWSGDAGCGDALQLLGPTNADGEYRSPYPNGISASYVECVRVSRQFGWLPTSPSSVTGRLTPGATLDVTFLMHDLGRDAMEVSGEVIIAGLPARGPAISLAAPFAECSGAVVSASEAFTTATLVIANLSRRVGCPGEGDSVSIMVNGITAITVSFVAAASKSMTFVVNGDSMRLFTAAADAAQIDGVNCAVVIPFAGLALSPPGLVGIFVLSDEVRPGCGEPGRLVRFFAQEQPLDPLVPWQPGIVQQAVDFTPASLATPTPTLRVLPPDTGTGGMRRNGGTGSTATIVLLAMTLGTAGMACFKLRQRMAR